MNAFVASELDIHGNVVSKRVVNSDRICSISVESASPSTARVFMKNGDAFTLPVEGRLKELIEGKWPPPPKPYDAQIEYLTTDMHSPYGDGNGNGAYIDTGLTWDALGPRDFVVETRNDLRFNWGIMTSGNVSSAWIGRSGDNMMFGNFSNRVANGGPSTGRHHNLFDIIDGLYVDGTLVAPAGTGWNAPPNHSVSLFVTRDSNKVPHAHWFIGSVGAVQFRRRSTGEILRDFIAVRKGTVGFLYDRANPTGGPLGNGLYPNAGIGSFVLGPDLPYDAEVEYLESTGTQYVDTGVTVFDPSMIEIGIDSDTPIPHGFTHQLNATGTWVSSYYVSNTYFVNYKDYTHRWTSTQEPTTRSLRVYDGGSGIYRDGTLQKAFTASVGTDSIANIPWPIGCVWDFNSSGYDLRYPLTGAKVYRIYIKILGVLVRDLHPVRVGSGASAVGYLYDRANPTGGPFGNGLYGNAADTGPLIAGPDVAAT